jgi:pimeloyl-ACP methyl ester carboxylesterase
MVDFGGSGPRILLVHGLAGSTVNWNAVAPALTDRGHVVAVDLPGFGLTPPWRDYTLETHLSALGLAVEHLGEPVELIGNSTGGLLCEMFAARFADQVSRMILIAPATPPVFPDPMMHWRTAARLAVEATPVLGELFIKNMIHGLTPRQLLELSLSTVTRHPGRVPVHLLEATLDLYEQRIGLPWVEKAINATASSIAGVYLRRGAFRHMVRSITAPTLVIHGLEDRIVSPTAVEWLLELRPDWDLVQMEGTGHVPQIDAPLRTIEIIDSWHGVIPVGAGSTAEPSN